MHRTVRKVLLVAFASTLLMVGAERVEARLTAATPRHAPPPALAGARAAPALPPTRAGVPRSPQLAKGLDRWFQIESSNEPSLTEKHAIRFADAGDGRIVATVHDATGAQDIDNPWNLAELSEVGGLPMISGYVDLPGGVPKSHEHSVLIWFTVDPEKPASLRVDAMLVHPPAGHPGHVASVDRLAMDSAGLALARALSSGERSTLAAIDARADGLAGLIGLLWHNGTWHGNGGGD